MEINEEKSDKIFLKKLHDICNLLDEIDENIKTNGERQQRVDYMLSDLEHTIENEELSDEEIIGITRKIQELRKIRRDLKNEYEIIREYNDHKNKLSLENQRPFFRQMISNKVKQLDSEYKNRVYTKEDIQEIKDSHKEHANVSNGYKVDIKKLIKLYSEGKKQSEIAKILNCTQPAILYQIKKLKEKGEI